MYDMQPILDLPGDFEWPTKLVIGIWSFYGDLLFINTSQQYWAILQQAQWENRNK